MLNNKNRIKFYHQLQSSDCAAACLAMIRSYFGKKDALSDIKHFFELTKVGVSIQELVDVAEKTGLSMTALKLTDDELKEIPLPIILYWKQEHFVVLEKIVSKKGKNIYYLADPAYGRISLDEESFHQEWRGDNLKGVGLYAEPNTDFDEISLQKKQKSNLFTSVFLKKAIDYIHKNKIKYLFSLVLIVLSLGFNWFMPFIFQKTIDLGIVKSDINLVYMLLLAQLVLFLSSFISDFFSQLILTKLNFNLSILLKSKLLQKLIKLPISYFDARLNTETLQRMGDQNRIQNFLTWKGIDFFLNILNIIVFGGILFYFSKIMFFIYLILSCLSTVWVLFFLKKREVLEYAMFLKQSQNNNYIYEFIMNMPEIKINNAQEYMINKIIAIQRKINALELRSLFLNTYQMIGVNFLSKLKEIIAIGICVFLIIDNQMTLGTLLSISYIVGQLTGPIQSIIGFVKDIQEVGISNERINDVYGTAEEDIHKTEILTVNDIHQISIDHVTFKYPGGYSPFVLEDITLNIPCNKVTAIVGASGSGKTTLLKLLLSYYSPTKGVIRLGKSDMKNIISKEWRKNCGIVLQDGHIFSGTIAENIVFSDDKIDEERLLKSAQIARINDFIESLPMGFHTKIGNIGMQLSGGQKQRILIARAVYKNPQFMFFDEATSALDAENEKMIHEQLQSFFKGRTVVIIAHRLSTVKNADNIVVLKKGKIVEQGTHQQLVNNRSDYYHLVKNQLELGA